MTLRSRALVGLALIGGLGAASCSLFGGGKASAPAREERPPALYLAVTAAGRGEVAPCG
jgi:hypothetical protein